MDGIKFGALVLGVTVGNFGWCMTRYGWPY